MKKLITILLVLISTVLVAQNFYRDTILERMVFEEVNVYRVEKGLVPFTWDGENTTAVAWGEYLTTVYQDGLTHSELTLIGTSEILVNIPMVNRDNLDVIKKAVSVWDNSPMHKLVVVNPESEVAFFAAIVYDGVASRTSNYKIKRVIFKKEKDKGKFLKREIQRKVFTKGNTKEIFLQREIQRKIFYKGEYKGIFLQREIQRKSFYKG